MNIETSKMCLLVVVIDSVAQACCGYIMLWNNITHYWIGDTFNSSLVWNGLPFPWHILGMSQVQCHDVNLCGHPLYNQCSFDFYWPGHSIRLLRNEWLEIYAIELRPGRVAKRACQSVLCPAYQFTVHSFGDRCRTRRLQITELCTIIGSVFRIWPINLVEFYWMQTYSVLWAESWVEDGLTISHVTVSHTSN